MRLFPARFLLTLFSTLSVVFYLISSRSNSNTTITKVIIISSNPRSGSTFFADLITPSGVRSSYWFEPFRWLHEVPYLNRKQLGPNRKQRGSNRDEVSAEEKLRMLEDFMSCEFRMYGDVVLGDDSRSITFRKPRKALGVDTLTLDEFLSGEVMRQLERDCRETEYRMLKTIRLHLDELLDYHSYDDLKVILLLRDPRAVLNSILSSPTPWDPAFSDPDRVCKNALRDLNTLKQMSPEKRSNVLLVKYENLMGDKVEELERIFGFLGLNIDSLGNAVEVEPVEEVSDGKTTPFWKKYFGTFRDGNFRHDGWKEKIPLELLNEAEKSESCQRVFGILGYEAFVQRNDSELSF